MEISGAHLLARAWSTGHISTFSTTSNTPTPAIQFGGNTPDRATNMFHLLASLAEAAQDEKDLPNSYH